MDHLLLSLLLVGACAGLHAQPAPKPTLAERAGLVNTIGMALVRIPAGEFLMGSDEPIAVLEKAYPLMERQRLQDLRDEAPVHRVRITKDFYLGRTEVTVGQFRRFLEVSGYIPESIADGTGGYGYNTQYVPKKGALGEQFEGRDTRYSWRNPGFAQTEAHPVVNVTWNDAQALARWLSTTEGRTYRLPTEAEWEYAARAGTRTRYQHGDDPQGLTGVANAFDASARPLWPAFADHALPGNDGYAFTAPVASFAPNAFGLYDMLGNEWEWTQDCYVDSYAGAPTDGSAVERSGCEKRVLRGGGYGDKPRGVRSAIRYGLAPSTQSNDIGFRVARTLR